MPRKKVTIENLSARVDNLTKIVEDLALMTKEGFDEMSGKFTDVSGRLTLTERNQQETNDRLNLVGRDLGEIKLRLSNVAYRFELEELEKRTQKVEDIVLARRRK